MTQYKEVSYGTIVPFLKEADAWISSIQESKSNQTYNESILAVNLAKEIEFRKTFHKGIGMMYKIIYNRSIQLLIIDQ